MIPATLLLAYGIAPPQPPGVDANANATKSGAVSSGASFAIPTVQCDNDNSACVISFSVVSPSSNVRTISSIAGYADKWTRVKEQSFQFSIGGTSYTWASEVWVGVKATAGAAANVTVTMSGAISGHVVYTMKSFYNINQATPVDANANALKFAQNTTLSNSSTALAVTSTATSGVVIGATMNPQEWVPNIVSSGFTSQNRSGSDALVGSFVGLAWKPFAGGAVSALSVDWGSKDLWNCEAFVLQAIAPPAPAPTIASVSPSSGVTTGGTAVTITGTDFTGATSVTIGGTSVSFVVVNDTTITATTPAHTAGAVDVAVTTPSGTGTGSSVFTYTVPAPTVTGISPNNGTAAGGTAVTITGTNFTGATAVTIGGTAVSSFTVVNDTTITTTTPAHAAGAVSVAVTTPSGTGTGSNLYTFNAVVSPGSQTFDSGSGSFVVPAFNTLVVEAWGGGASGDDVPFGTTQHGTAGGQSSVSTLGLVANGGQPGAGSGKTSTGGAGGTAGGGDVNSTGGAGQSGGGTSGGAGGNAPNGGTGGAAGVVGGANGGHSGSPGNAPGAGGGAASFFISGNAAASGVGAGGGAGGYVKKTYTAGQIAVGASLAYAAGAGAPTNAGTSANGGAGANGRVKFTWS